MNIILTFLYCLIKLSLFPLHIERSGQNLAHPSYMYIDKWVIVYYVKRTLYCKRRVIFPVGAVYTCTCTVYIYNVRRKRILSSQSAITCGILQHAKAYNVYSRVGIHIVWAFSTGTEYC